MTAWAHLPNAKVIDDIVADVKARPEVWSDAENATWAELNDSPWGEAWVAGDDRLHGTTRDATMSAAASAASAISRAIVGNIRQAQVNNILEDILLALIAWDSSADLLTLTSDALRTIIDTCDGDVRHQAVLLLPAVIARHTS